VVNDAAAAAAAADDDDDDDDDSDNCNDYDIDVNVNLDDGNESIDMASDLFQLHHDCRRYLMTMMKMILSMTSSIRNTKKDQGIT